MTFQTSDSDKVTQVFPERRQRLLEGLYFGQKLAGISVRVGRTLVIINFLTDRKGIVTKEDEHRNFPVPFELKNTSDWRLLQELMAQASPSPDNHATRLTARAGFVRLGQ